MSQNYQRYQIILTEKTSDFSAYGKKAFGKCMLEAKGESVKVSLSIQNLKPATVCSAYIIAPESGGSLAIDIGRVAANTAGRAELKWECRSANSVDGSGFMLKDFSVAGLMIIEGSSAKAPIIGYKNGEVSWRDNLRIHKKTVAPSSELQPETVTYSAPTAADEEGLLEDNFVDITTDTPKAFCEKIPPALDAAAAAQLIEGFEVPQLPEYPSSEPEEFFETMEEGAAEKALKEVAHKINEKLNEMDALSLEQPQKGEEPQEAAQASELPALLAHEHQHLQNIFQNFSKIRPFKEQGESEEWVRITPNELNFLPEAFAHLHADMRVLTAYKKFNHLIFGRKSYGEYVDIAFGMPDVYAVRNEEAVKASGFVGFQNCDCEKPLEGSHGYWLLIVKYGN